MGSALCKVFVLIGSEYLDELFSVAADLVENRVHLLYFATELVTDVEHVMGEESKVSLLASQDLYWLLGMLVLNYDALLVDQCQKVLGVWVQVVVNHRVSVHVAGLVLLFRLLIVHLDVVRRRS